MHHDACSSPASAPHSGHGSISAGSKMAVMSRSLLRFSARASSNRRCRPFFTGQPPVGCVGGESVPPVLPADAHGRYSARGPSGPFPITSGQPSASRPSSAPLPCRVVVAPWWQTGVFYQIYPRSFATSRGLPTGDLAGIEAHLDHVQWLGVDAVWLSPFYPSPMADFGYDVADYCDVDPVFGSLADFDALLADAHARGLKVIVDLVANHTSDQHPWFQESRASRTSPKRDWYIWRDPAPGGGPPNNWLSEFGGGAWEYDAASGQYYLHTFLTSQPDLNWRNPGMRDAMYEVVRFWLRRGVDGFRADAIRHLIKDDAFRDNPPN